MSDIKIREAEKTDIDVILELSKELAEYEDALDIYEGTEKFHNEILFSGDPMVKAYLLEVDSKIAGMAHIYKSPCVYTNRYDWNLLNFVFFKDNRGKGYGYKLFRHIVELAEKSNCKNINWGAFNENIPAIKMYEKYGAKVIDESTFFQMDSERRQKFLNSFK